MNVATLSIRAARKTDVAAIRSLDAKLAGSAKPGYWSRILAAYTSDEKGRVALVAEQDEKLVGFLFGEVRAWEFGSAPCGWVFSVASDPDVSRQGIATMLLKAAVDRFREAGVEVVRTMVRRDDVPVLAFFRSMGFCAGPFAEMELTIGNRIGRQ